MSLVNGDALALTRKAGLRWKLFLLLECSSIAGSGLGLRKDSSSFVTVQIRGDKIECEYSLV